MLTELPGFHSAATRESFGINSLSNSTRLPCSSGVLWLTPVMFPPGRARLATSPDPTGSATVENTTGTVVVAPFAASAPGVAKATMTSTPQFDEVGGESRETFVAPFGPAQLQGHVLAFDVPELGEPLPQRRDVRARPGAENAELPRGATVSAVLQFVAAPTALLGGQDVIVESSAFDGRLVVCK
jgi:hypothetical protein